MRALLLRRTTLAPRLGALCFPSPLTVSRMWAESDATAGDAAAKGQDQQQEKKEDPAAKPQEDPSMAQISKLEKELAKAKEEIAELKKDVLYRAAEAENARRIGRDDVEKAKLYGITSFGKDILEVADTLEKGIQAFEKMPEEQLNSNKSLSSICTGVKLSSKVLLKNLAKHGIEKVSTAKGDKFDPNIHDALVRVPVSTQCPNDTVAEILKEGYKIKGRVLRAAQVAVASNEV